MTSGSSDRRATNLAVGFAVLLAFYTGVRLPNSWSVTLQTTSLFDGFHRRFLVGTLLRPFAALFGYHYAFYATLSFLILGALLAVLVWTVVRTPALAPRLWIIAWLALPTGGFLFNEVGYFDQLLYLILFGAIALVHRGRVVAATVVMSLTPLIHELAILSVLPLYGLVLFRAVPFKRAAIATAIPTAINLVLLVIPAASPHAVDHLAQQLMAAGVPYRPDALVLFNRTQHDSWALYKIHGVVRYVRPATEVMLVVFGAFWLTGRGAWLRATERHREVLVWLVSSAAIA
ncbi:MAG TPA: hypothetical protein VLT45_26990, partial [Kofleriaceae bacterium]|nr:hypothetical protein [Kofleriaceae bacterium]